MKLFYTRTHTQVEYKSVISRVSSIAYLGPYSKLFLCEISFPTKFIGQNLTTDLGSTSVRVQILFVYTLLLFFKRISVGVNNDNINDKNSTHTCILVCNTQIYDFRDNNKYNYIYDTCPMLCGSFTCIDIM